jgi:hypothetical protein
VQQSRLKLRVEARRGGGGARRYTLLKDDGFDQSVSVFLSENWRGWECCLRGLVRQHEIGSEGRRSTANESASSEASNQESGNGTTDSIHQRILTAEQRAAPRLIIYIYISAGRALWLRRKKGSQLGTKMDLEPWTSVRSSDDSVSDAATGRTRHDGSHSLIMPFQGTSISQA